MATATEPDERTTLLSIGAVAQLLNVSPSLIRKWERAGVIPPAPRLVGSERRVYSPRDVEAIRSARAARRLETVRE